MTKLFNTPFEMELRLSLLLSVDSSKPYTVERMVALDFISCYAADFSLPFANLHGDNDFKYGEISSRRVLVHEAVKDMVTKGLVTVEVNRGYIFTISAKGQEYAEKMQSAYAKTYCEIAKATVTKYGNDTDEEILEIIQERSIHALRGKNYVLR